MLDGKSVSLNGMFMGNWEGDTEWRNKGGKE